MKQHINKLILAVVIISAPAISFGQYCNYFHTKYCMPSENELFKLNGQSKSALFSKGQTSDLSIIVYKGQDYRISVCMDENLGSQIKFKIYQTVKKKVEKITETKTMEDVLDENGNPTGEQKEVINRETKIITENVKELLYDNSTDGFANEIEFSVESTRRLTLEVSVPGGSGGEGSKKSKGKLMKSSDMGCIGILVEHMTTPISGFYGTGF
jgi:hypothetical protein